MENFLLHFLNIFFFTFHTALILFNLFGWLFRKTRKLHLAFLFLTLFSWTVLGIWKGFGYCFLTDWHYDILLKLGHTDMPNSYIAFLVETFFNWQPNAELVNTVTLVVTAVVLLCSVLLNIKDFKQK